MNFCIRAQTGDLHEIWSPKIWHFSEYYCQLWQRKLPSEFILAELHLTDEKKIVNGKVFRGFRK